MLSPGIQIYTGELSPKKLHAFLIMWSHFSIKMTEPVESWISRAGGRCIELGFESVGKKLKYHASQESDHDLMLVDDLKVLIARWNDIYQDTLRVEDLDVMNPPQNTNAYVDIHENTISGQHPYAQVAIEFEIERISVAYGPQMVENVVNTLGADFEKGIGFLAHHVLLDQGHTKFNKALIEECMATGASTDVLAATGAGTLRIYADFLMECSAASQKLLERGQEDQWKSHLTM